MGDEVKIGAMISATNKTKIQAAIDVLSELISTGGMIDPEKTIVTFGGEVKALGEGKLGGYLVRFTTDRDPDLTGDFFTASTNYGEHKSTPVMYQHGMDSKLKARVIGSGTLTRDNVGVWIEAQLSMRDEYEKAIYEMAQAGKLGWSSGTASHLVEREPQGKSYRITAWPLGLDASLTPTPAESRNSAVTLKSLIIGKPEEPDGALDTASKTIEPTLLKEGKVMPEFTEEQLEAFATKAATKAIEEYKRAEPATVTAGANVTVVKDAADQPFKSMREFYGAVKNSAMYPGSSDVRLLPLKATGMSEGVPADGGYLIPPSYASGILKNMWGGGQILPRVSNDPVTGNSMTYNLVDETSRVAGSRWGGIRGYWLSEGGTLTASKPTFRQWEAKLKKLGALVYATDEQLEDTANLESFITSTVPEELRFLAEDAIFEGDGVGKPWGIIAAPALVSFARVDANKVQHDDVMKMWARRKVGGSYVWLVNQDVTPQLDQMYITSGIESRFVDYDAEGVLRMKGAPVIETEYNATLGTLGDIVLADLNQYKLITKGGVRAESSIHVQFTTDEMTYRFIYRCDGHPLWASAVTPFHGSNTVSPFVALTAAS
ncbi:MAG: phage major capsid protein [Gallionella sp.]|jgi:HK97 family phage major capsid protein